MNCEQTGYPVEADNGPAEDQSCDCCGDGVQEQEVVLDSDGWRFCPPCADVELRGDPYELEPDDCEHGPTILSRLIHYPYARGYYG